MNPVEESLPGAVVGALWGILGGFGYALVEDDAKKETSMMTALETAFNGLIPLLCDRLAEAQGTIEKLRRELAARPIQAQLDAASGRADAANAESTKLREEVARLRGQITSIASGRSRRRAAP
jgi:hypothetical protein